MFPSSATPLTIPPPSPNVFAVIPLAPSAPMTASTATVAPSTRMRRSDSTSTRTPSRNVAPASTACSTRNSSSRLRWVIRHRTWSEERSITAPYFRRHRARVIRSSTTGSTETGSWRTARVVRPPPQGLSRGKRTLSISKTRACARARRYEVVAPAGPAPTTATSKRSTPQGYNGPPLKGVCPSGQRERAVNPSAQPTEVRILPPPFHHPARGLDSTHEASLRRPWNRHPRRRRACGTDRGDPDRAADLLGRLERTQLCLGGRPSRVGLLGHRARDAVPGRQLVRQGPDHGHRLPRRPLLVPRGCSGALARAHIPQLRRRRPARPAGL